MAYSELDYRFLGRDVSEIDMPREEYARQPSRRSLAMKENWRKRREREAQEAPENSE